jgi:hypothetical protein
MATQQSDLDLRRYAVVGAEARLLQMAQEAEAIYRAFPELRVGRGQLARTTPTNGNASPSGAQRRRRSKMSPAQRQAVSERMKKYWAGKRGTAEAPKATEPKQTAAGQATSSSRRGRPRKMSAAARKRISRAQKARWAKVRARKNLN